MVEKKIEKKSIEDVLSIVGEYGPFQWILNAIFIVMQMAICVHLMIGSFSTLPPSWQCAVNSSVCTQNVTYSGDNLERCKYSRSDWQYVGVKDFSLISTFNLDCEREWLAHFITSIMFLAWVIGSLFFGWISDNYGRKPILFVSTGVIIVVGFASSFSKSLPLYIVCRFVNGFFFAGAVLQGFVIISEIVGIHFRPFAGTIIFLGNLFGWSSVALESYFVNNWRTLHILSTAPYIIVFLFYRFVPESIQWQYEQGRIEEVKVTMRRIAHWNKKKVSLKEIHFESPKKDKKTPNPTDLFKTKRITQLTLAQGLMWFCVACGYYGSLFSVSNFGGSVYLNFILLNFGAVFSYFIGPYCCTRFGRKRSCITFHFIAAVLCICNGFIPFKFVTVRVVLGMVGLNFVSMGFNTCYVWSSEIYPTRIRTEGLGFMEICSRIGSALSPWIGNYLRHFGDWVPNTTMGLLLVVCGLSGLPLPETKDGSKDFTQKKKEKSEEVGDMAGIENSVFSDGDV